MGSSLAAKILLRYGQRSELYSGGSAKVNGKEAVQGGWQGGFASRPAGLLATVIAIGSGCRKSITP